MNTEALPSHFPSAKAYLVDRRMEQCLPYYTPTNQSPVCKLPSHTPPAATSIISLFSIVCHCLFLKHPLRDHTKYYSIKGKPRRRTAEERGGEGSAGLGLAFATCTFAHTHHLHQHLQSLIIGSARYMPTPLWKSDGHMQTRGLEARCRSVVGYGNGPG